MHNDVIAAVARAKVHLRRTAPTLLMLVAAALVTVALAACAAPAAQAADPAPPAVTASQAVGRDITEWNEFTGRLEPVHDVEVRPRVSGLIASVRFQEGTLVRRGDLLFEIDPRPFQTEVDRLRAELARSQASLTRAMSERDRATRLAAENAVSGEEHDRRVSAADEASAGLAAMRAALRAAELNLEFTRVTAPISGRVGHAIVTEGNLVSSGPGTATLLTTVVSLDPIYASFDVDEQAYLALPRAARTPDPITNRVSGGKPAMVAMALSGEDDFARRGRIDFLDNQLNAATGTIRVRAVFDNPNGELTPGLFVRLRMNGRNAYRGVLVRDQAIGTDLDKRFVYVITPDKTVAYRSVSLGPLVDGLRVVRTGISAGDTVIVNGLQRVRPGSRVTAEVTPMAVAQ